jgi:hypothetical protein
MSRQRFNVRFGPGDLTVLLTSGQVQIVDGKNEFWIQATDKLKESVKVDEDKGKRIVDPAYGKSVKSGWGKKRYGF